eukprot:COSAG02_NODE_4597_length_5179_cov_102.404528_1_plen_266_part_10
MCCVCRTHQVAFAAGCPLQRTLYSKALPRYLRASTSAGALFCRRASAGCSAASALPLFPAAATLTFRRLSARALAGAEPPPRPRTPNPPARTIPGTPLPPPPPLQQCTAPCGSPGLRTPGVHSTGRHGAQRCRPVRLRSEQLAPSRPPARHLAPCSAHPAQPTTQLNAANKKALPTQLYGRSALFANPPFPPPVNFTYKFEMGNLDVGRWVRISELWEGFLSGEYGGGGRVWSNSTAPTLPHLTSERSSSAQLQLQARGGIPILFN